MVEGKGPCYLLSGVTVSLYNRHLPGVVACESCGMQEALDHSVRGCVTRAECARPGSVATRNF